MSLIQGSGQFPVGCSRRLQLLGPLPELAAPVSKLLLKMSDAALKLVEVGRGTEADRVLR
ncbi:hypothetical protein AB0C98_09715 [Streptomyces sp. NPDC048558]|uniref:hypothetical protein n=1 Tax=Streptomyces sp. NPDC048558 TaxID=3155759 RepID=UPI0033F3BEB6